MCFVVFKRIVVDKVTTILNIMIISVAITILNNHSYNSIYNYN